MKNKIKRITNIFSYFKEKNIFVLAAAVAFYAFLSLFPFFIMVIYFSTLFLREAVTVAKIKRHLRIFPAAVSETVMDNLENILQSGQIFTFVSLIFLMYLAFKVFSHMEKALSQIFELETIRKGWKANIRAFLFFLFTAFILLVLFISGNTFLFLSAKLEKIPFIKSYYLILVGHVVVETLFFASSYRYFSQRKVAFKNAVIGGFLATVLWEILKHVFGLYIVRVKLYSIVYGSIGSIILLQLWLYYSVLVYLFGAKIGSDLT